MTDNDTVIQTTGRRPILLKLAALVLLAAAVGATLYARKTADMKASPDEEVKTSTNQVPEPSDTPAEAVATVAASAGDSPVVTLPTLLDLGATKCIPCKMMAPILEELKVEYANQLKVVFIDVWQNPEASKAHNINLIPTQIFLDAEGKELYRHEGFFAKADILAKWKELGVDLAAGK